jgi:hypothetical protein
MLKIRLFYRGLPNLPKKNTGHPVKLDFQIGSVLVYVIFEIYLN